MGEKIETSSSSSSSSSSSLNGNVNVNDNGRMVNNSLSSSTKFPLTFWEMAAATGVVLGFGVALSCVYLTMPHSDYSFLKLPRNLNDIQTLRDDLESYTNDYTAQVLTGYCMVYIFMQTFMIPGTVFMSLLAGSLFGVSRGVALVVFNATVAKRHDSLLNYMLFLRVTPTLPNTFINLASPIVGVPFHIFFFATLIGLIPAAFVTVRAGIALGDLRTMGDLYDMHSIATLFLIGIVSVTPTLMNNKSKS